MDARLLKVLNGSEQNYPQALEKQFPRVFEKIMALWDSSQEFEAYMVDLMTTTRTDRQGFPREVASDIIYLIMLHERINSSSDTYSWVNVLRDNQT
jgi:hypothetical protein